MASGRFAVGWVLHFWRGKESFWKPDKGKTAGMKTRLERFALGTILAPVAPLVGLMSFWWTAYALLSENWIPFATLAGMAFGILADIFLLKKLLDHKLSYPQWMAVYLFYAIGIFGFFMGVPVFHVLLAIPAGFVIGSRLASEHADHQQVRRTARRMAWFTTGVLALVCAASACIALASPSTAQDLRGMLGLGFAVTRGMLIGLILVGGASLLAAGWGLSVATVRFTFRILQQ
jgi:hypothetical protein